MGNAKGRELRPSVRVESLLYGFCFGNGLAFRLGNHLKNLLKTGYETEGKGGRENLFSHNYVKCHVLPLGVVATLDRHTCKKHRESMVN